MISTGLDAIYSGLVSGIIATAVMTMSEIPSWRKWGLWGVFEWHENQILSTRFFHIARNQLNFKYIFFLHFLNGSLAGIAFSVMLSILNIPIIIGILRIESMTENAIPANDPFRKCRKKIYLKLS